MKFYKSAIYIVKFYGHIFTISLWCSTLPPTIARGDATAETTLNYSSHSPPPVSVTYFCLFYRNHHHHVAQIKPDKKEGSSTYCIVMASSMRWLWLWLQCATLVWRIPKAINEPTFVFPIFYFIFFCFVLFPHQTNEAYVNVNVNFYFFLFYM